MHHLCLNNVSVGCTAALITYLNPTKINKVSVEIKLVTIVTFVESSSDKFIFAFVMLAKPRYSFNNNINPI